MIADGGWHASVQGSSLYASTSRLRGEERGGPDPESPSRQGFFYPGKCYQLAIEWFYAPCFSFSSLRMSGRANVLFVLGLNTFHPPVFLMLRFANRFGGNTPFNTTKLNVVKGTFVRPVTLVPSSRGRLQSEEPRVWSFEGVRQPLLCSIRCATNTMHPGDPPK